jgi:hypothetical protein
MAHPSIDTSGFEKGSGFRAYLERCRAHELAGQTGYHAAEAEIRALLKAQTLNPFSQQARRIARPLRVLAEMKVDEARLLALCLQLHRGAFPPVHATTGARRVHDPNA